MNSTDYEIREVENVDAFLSELPPDAAWADGLKKAITNVENSRGSRESTRVVEARRSERLVGGAVYEPASPDAHFHFVAVADGVRLDIRKKNLGGSHPDYATSLNNVAGLYYSMEFHSYRRLDKPQRQASARRPGKPFQGNQ